MSKVARSFAWSAAERFSVQGISFLLGIVIARIVSPSSFGLIVIVQIFLSFSQLLIDGGFANALIQKKDRDETDYCTVFFFNLGIAVGLYLLLFFLAPLIAKFYEEPKLTSITRVISLNLILSSLAIVQKTRLTINLDFKTQTRASLLAVVISGIVGILCAFSGFEVWALVVQHVVNQLIISVALMRFSRWRPKLLFSVQSFKRLFSFGSKLMLSNILTSIYINVTSLVIGKKYSSADLAFYNRGYNISQFPSTNLSEGMNRVIFSVLTRVQDDMDSLRKEYLKYLHLAYYIVLPLMGLLLVLARPLIEVLLTAKWLDTVPYLQIFCLNFMLYPLQQQTGNPVAAIGHSDILLKAQILKRIVSFGILIVTLTISIPAVCWGILATSTFETAVNVFICRKEIGVGFRMHIKALLDVIVLSAIICVVVFFFVAFIPSDLLKLLIGGTLGIMLYILATWIFNLQEKNYLIQIIANVKSQMKKSN